MSIEKRNLVCKVCGEPYMACIRGVPYCNKHYQSVYRYGHPNGKPRKSTNSFEVLGNVLKITTKKGVAIFSDAENMELLSKHSWCLSKTGYAVANIKGRVTKMHRHILANRLAADDVVDHINGNPLDNRKENLRICKQCDNAKNIRIKSTNKIGVKGVRLTENGRYNARIVINFKEIHLGNYLPIEEAVKARKQAELKYYGEFAPCLRGEI